MSITLREVARARRAYLQDLRSCMSKFDAEQEKFERAIKTIIGNPARIPEPKDMERFMDYLEAIIRALDILIKLLGLGLPEDSYTRQYKTTRRKKRATVSRVASA